MNKKEVQKRVLQNGKPLDLEKFTWDEETRTFVSGEGGLIFDFKYIDRCNFITGPNCYFITGFGCTFKTSLNCNFITDDYCTFNTGSDCTFNTGSDCTFNTGSRCNFRTTYNCTFDTHHNCTFDVYSNCTFKTGENCFVIRRDVWKVLKPKPDKKTMSNNSILLQFAKPFQKLRQQLKNNKLKN